MEAVNLVLGSYMALVTSFVTSSVLDLAFHHTTSEMFEKGFDVA